MIGIITGVLIGVVTVTIVALLCDLFDFDMLYRDRVWHLIFAAIIAVFSAGGYQVEKSIRGRYIEQYIATKSTIETSLKNDTLTGLERVQLVQQASKANSELAGYKYDCRQWYGIAFDDRALELEPIDISGGAKDG